MDMSVVDTLWVLVCTGLVFVMQAGFLCLESGLTRSKNAINVAIKNITDFSVSMLLFWAYGFAVMFGISWSGWIGTSHFFVPMDQQNSTLTTMFIFQGMFCATAATIVSGAVAGRMRYRAYIITAFIVSGLIYPIFGHWAWGGAYEGAAGWLSKLGFVDFAGSTVVHGIGGWAGLAAALVLGPRIGRFAKDGKPRKVASSNMPLAMLGALLLWMGWIGFNGGSTLSMNDQVPGIIGNTFLAGAAGMLTALVLGWWLSKHADVSLVINGALAGLVAITAACHAVGSVAAVLIGGIGAIVMVGAGRLLVRFQVDDAVGVVPVHAAAGAWGTIAVALFGDPAILATGLSRWEQLQVQAIGVVVAMFIAFGGVSLLLRLIRHACPLRVTPEQEQLGLNISEHDASTDTFDLIMQMENQRQLGDFSSKVTVEPYSEVETISAQYNRVLDRVTEEVNKSESLHLQLVDAAREAGQAEVAINVLHNVGNVLNSVNVSAGLIQDKIQRSSTSSLTKAVGVIEQHLDHLGDYVTQDERGKHLPRFLADLSQQMASDEELILEEVQSLTSNINHIKTIVATQQSYATGVSAVVEGVPLAELLEDAIRINTASTEGHSIEIVQQFDDIGPVVVDKQKLLQIVVNLISNAKYACMESGNENHQLTVSLRRTGEDRVSIEVRDNGMGIAAENLTRIFAHGFTTRKEGHGFGLHGAALAAKELDGSLMARSEGAGTGATFTIDLPYKEAGVSPCLT